MYGRIVQIINEFSVLFQSREQWRGLRDQGAGKKLLVFGNGPSVKRLDLLKLAKFHGPNSTDLAFVNGFLHAPPFPIDDYNCLYFIADPLILRLINWLAEGGREKDLFGADFLGELFEDAPDQAIHSLQYDARSLVTALKLNNISWFCPISFMEKLNKLGVKNCYPVSRLTIPNSWPLIFNKLAIKMNVIAPNQINPLGPAVLNYAILAGINLNYDEIIVLGHNDELNYSNFRMDNKKLYFKYRYFWEKSEREYLREDSWSNFVEAQFKNIQIERYLAKKILTPIRFIAPSHLHLFFTDPGFDNILLDSE